MLHDELLMIIAAFACGMAIALGQAVPPLPPELANASDALARDVVAAMLVHDSSVRTLRWKQTHRQHVAAAGADGVCTSMHVIDDRGRWATSYDRTSYGGPGVGFVRTAARLVYDGTRLVASSEAKRSLTIDRYRGEKRPHVSVECWLGREVDSGRRRLGEVLLNAPDLAARRVEGGFEVSGTADVPGLVALVEVEIDSEHGFAPRVITIRDRALRVPYFRYEVIRFVSLDGTWLPEKTVLLTRKFQPGPDEMKELSEALGRRGLGRDADIHDPRIQQLYEEALVDAFGSMEAPSKQLAEPVRVEFEYVALNQSVDDGEFRILPPAEFLVVDFISDRIRPRGENKWVRRLDFDTERERTE